MNPTRALKIIPREAVLTAETRSDRYGGAWVIVARMDGYERVVTQFSASDAFGAAHWLASYNAGIAP